MKEIISVDGQCTKCSTDVRPDQKFCVNCGYPQNGTVSEKAVFNANAVMDRSKTKDAPRRIRSARNSLFVISGLSMLYGIFVFFMNDDIATLIASVILSIIYLVLGFWSQQKPLIALVLGLLVYATIIVVNGIFDPSTIYKGALIKIFIIVYLSKGINSALHLRNSNS